MASTKVVFASKHAKLGIQQHREGTDNSVKHVTVVINLPAISRGNINDFSLADFHRWLLKRGYSSS